MSKVIRCDCKADKRGNKQAAQYQDRKYGEGNRVHTVGLKDKATCTVCGSSKTNK